MTVPMDFPALLQGNFRSFWIVAQKYDRVYAIGPLPMMKFVCKLTATADYSNHSKYESIMIDGTGMCGCCRVTVDGQVKFACA